MRWARDRKDNWVQQGVVVAAVRQQTIGNFVREKTLWRIKKRYQMSRWSGVHYIVVVVIVVDDVVAVRRQRVGSGARETSKKGTNKRCQNVVRNGMYSQYQVQKRGNREEC